MEGGILPGMVYGLQFTVYSFGNFRTLTVNRKPQTVNLLLLALASLFSGCLGHLPSKEELKKIQTYTASEIYSSDSVLLGRYFIENRTNASFSEISPNIINALIATEDVRFYRHEGVDTRSLFRVLIKTIILGDESSGGGSTISQQLVKNLFPRKKGSFAMLRNKVREAIVAFRLEDVYSKEELLTLYLNTVSFGEEVFGIETAAERYFSIKPVDAEIGQAATLVGMLKAPSLYNPRTHPENALHRRNTVISQMAKYNFITDAAADTLKALPLALNYNKQTHETGIAAHFREMLRLHLDQQISDYNHQNNSNYNLYTDGLKIYTTIDSRLQLHAEEAMKKHMAALQKEFDAHWSEKKPWDSDPAILDLAIRNSERFKAMLASGMTEEEAKKRMKRLDTLALFSWVGDTITGITCEDSLKYTLMLLQTGMLVMEPATGDIKAWVGGIDYRHFKFDHVTSKRQVGSTFKPIVYAAAIEAGISPCEYFPNERKTYDDYEGWSPQNSDNLYGGYYSMQGALAYSVNVIAPEVMIKAGIENVTNLADSMGINGDIPAVPSLALGAADISLMEMTTAYCAFANRGAVPVPRFLTQVMDASGSPLITTASAPPRAVMAAATAQTITRFLQTVVDSGTASALRSRFGFEFDIAGKTGTTQNHSDGWFIGYTPALVCGVWTGADNPQIHFRDLSSGQGAAMALPAWGYFMERVAADDSLNYVQQHFHIDSRLLAKLDCPLYKDYENLWDRLFGKRHRRRSASADADTLEAMAGEKQPEKTGKTTFRDRVRNAFRKK